jgi:chromosome partitioning protein
MNTINQSKLLDIYERSTSVLSSIRDVSNEPFGRKTFKKMFSRPDVCHLTGISAEKILKAERNGDLESPFMDGKKRVYSLNHINRIRHFFNVLPWRKEGEIPVVLAVQNFKGGVGKTTISTHLAYYLAIMGYRVCFIDCDSQASATELFGFIPDFDLGSDDTLLPFIIGKQDSLEYAIKETHCPGIDIIPANMSLHSAEDMLAQMFKENPLVLNMLRGGIKTIKFDYDVVIIDPPPALGMISLSVLRAADSMLIPVTPSIVDFSSTTHFIDMVLQSFNDLKQYGIYAEYGFMRLVVSKANEGKMSHKEIVKILEATYGNLMLSSIIRDSAEIDNANSRLMTVFEQEGSLTSSQETYRRCLRQMTDACREIEELIRLSFAGK